jgi:rod shape determining protein RodA
VVQPVGNRLTIPHNWYLLGLALALSLSGLAMLYSAGQTASGENSEFWQYQVIWLFVALIAYATVGVLPLRFVEKSSWFVYAIGVLFLIAVLAFPAVGGARSWIRFGSLGFQPSEFAKLGAILVVARWVASLEHPPRKLSALTMPAMLMAIPGALTLLQPDIGTATVFVLLLAGLCFWAGAPPLMIFLLLSPIVSILLTFSLPLWSFYIVGVGLIVFLLSPGRGTLEPEIDPRGAGWNVIQSKVAIGSGGWFGKGFMEGTQNRLAFLPERQTDFIFSVLGEELGFIGVLVAFTLFALLLVEGVRIAERNPDAFGSTVAFGLVVLIASHVVINTAMTVGLLPITGLPLPFLSKGGSFLVVCFVTVALWRQIWYERFLTKRA